MSNLVRRVKRRADWYKNRFTINNPVVGRAVELAGNKVRMDGLTYSVDAPQISRGHKSTLAFGYHEMEERELIRRWLPSSVPVIELGGGLGVVSCLSNRCLDHPQKHIVVEANPDMIAVLDRNRRLNGCQFSIINKAIAYDCDSIEFNIDSEFVGSGISAKGTRTVLVQTTTILQIMHSANFSQAGIVCDIEGAEAAVIEREFPTLGERIRFIMAEMHPAILGKDAVDGLLARLVSLGFQLKQSAGDSVFLARA